MSEHDQGKIPSLLIADDHTLILEGMRKLLEGEFDLLGTAEDGRALVEKAERLQPDVVMLDITMPLLNGFEAARRIRQSCPQTKIVFVTMQSEATYVREAMRIGASAYLLKRSPPSELIQAIHKVVAGQLYLTPLLSQHAPCLTPESENQPLEQLTPRQREVLQLVAEGRSGKEIAHTLCISLKTVEFHKASIGRELGLRTTAELTRYAMEHGLVR